MHFNYNHITDRDNILHTENIQMWTCAFLPVQPPEAPGLGATCIDIMIQET